ncbi:ABC transporter [candidate division WWE3 bacterium CG10_big_fil_rev_8_21_14_0_10_32_10]|uniref:ABC transporter n=1 Tax=candidate division WWE3 bacterium CG10_big_fil_rev_8_21_14_0_10_32_10 TaxID=1975090 RepID=A0A2H0R9B6_UNCKA|nr:MAG: ABC transporter [candidate division WWE3 bacterium CG10_big_fil_rev_8_21_14_0_10_32_10]
MKNTIEVKNLSKSFRVHKKEEGLKASIKAVFKRKYNTISAVNNISFNINQGELVGFIGPNGAGKTTTLKMLSGLLYPSEGYIKILGNTPSERKHSFLKQISMVMGQKNQLFWDLPAIETFNLNKEIYEVPEKKYRILLEELVEMLDVKDIINQQVRKLSLGQRMKCELIASLIHTPKMLFLDEPTIGLDVVIQKKLRVFIKEYNRKYNSTIILTSHYMGDVQELCDRVIIINKGEIGYDGKLNNLVKEYAKNKTITLIFLKEVKKSILKKYGKIISYDPLKISFEIPRDKIREKASNMLKDLPVDDLDIQEIPIEEIIRQVFESSTPKPST